jgi:hypothetical protein
MHQQQTGRHRQLPAAAHMHPCKGQAVHNADIRHEQQGAGIHGAYSEHM